MKSQNILFSRRFALFYIGLSTYPSWSDQVVRETFHRYGIDIYTTPLTSLSQLVPGLTSIWI